MFPAHSRGDGVRLIHSFQSDKVFDPQSNPRFSVHDLHGRRVHFDEARAQALVSCDELLERMFQGFAVEITPKAHRRRHVIGPLFPSNRSKNHNRCWANETGP
jgi:hypothetical protein